MMEKPLAVSLEDARAIERAAREGNIPVLVNYETSYWYPSNHAAYDLVHSQGTLGDISEKVVGPRRPSRAERNRRQRRVLFNWLTDPRLNGGGALFDFGCYGADLMTLALA